MIIVKLIGGLGNQLFQYAAAKSLAIHHSVPFKLDISSFKEYQLRNFELPSLKAEYEIASFAEIKQYNRQLLVRKVIQSFLPHHKRKIYKEPHFHWDKNFFLANNNLYLKGYWQSPKYFSSIDNIIREDFIVKDEFINNVKSIGSKMSAEESVSIHIRRGDYTQKEIINFHGILTSDYYNKAINILHNKYPLTKFYFFSDDIEWVKKNIIIDFDCEFISKNYTQSAIEDFYLMSKCRHNIIANSSFSWWAAWLNKNLYKTVIAPKKWFNDINYNTNDLIPDNWIRI